MQLRIIRLLILPLFAFVILSLSQPATVRAEGEPLLDYGADLVSNYVSRGNDLHVAVFDKESEKHEAFNASPALQPSLTFHGPGGFSFGLWGSFALTDREPEADKNFDGLKTVDEVDYTLAWDWENKLGAFTVGYATYANVPENGTLSELFLTWGFPFAEVVAPSLTHYVEQGSANTYTALGFGGGESLSWSLSLGWTKKLQDVTGGVGYAIGDFSVSLNASHRPNPELIGYDKDGKYILADGSEADYPPTIAWVALSYGGTVTD